MIAPFLQETKPGLSNFANDPDKAKESVGGLLDKAKEIIPEESWPHTPLALKATAGLRLLPEEEAEAILDKVPSLEFSSFCFVSPAAREIIVYYQLWHENYVVFVKNIFLFTFCVCLHICSNREKCQSFYQALKIP